MFTTIRTISTHRNPPMVEISTEDGEFRPDDIDLVRESQDFAVNNEDKFN